jgi:hypothetical protein
MPGGENIEHFADLCSSSPATRDFRADGPWMVILQRQSQYGTTLGNVDVVWLPFVLRAIVVLLPRCWLHTSADYCMVLEDKEERSLTERSLLESTVNKGLDPSQC